MRHVFRWLGVIASAFLALAGAETLDKSLTDRIILLAVGLAVGFGLRLLYRRRRRNVRLVAWPTFIIAAFVCFASALGQNQATTDKASNAAASQGIVSSASAATPVDRCVGSNLAAWDNEPDKRPTGATKAEYRAFATDICKEGFREGVLLNSGAMYESDMTRVAKVVVKRHGPYFP